jgi:hypothetical protein
LSFVGIRYCFSSLSLALAFAAIRFFFAFFFPSYGSFYEGVLNGFCSYDPVLVRLNGSFVDSRPFG